MEKQKSGKTKHINLGPLQDRVNEIAQKHPVHRTAAAVIRAAVEKYVQEWDASQPEPAVG